MLHILNKAPSSEAANQALQALGENDALVLIEDAVQAILYPDWEGWKQKRAAVYLLKEDVEARGLPSNNAEHRTALLDLNEFVELSTQHTRSVTWY